MRAGWLGAMHVARGPLWLVAALAFLPGLPLPQRPRAGGGNRALGCCSCVPSLLPDLLPLAPPTPGQAVRTLSSNATGSWRRSSRGAEFVAWGRGGEAIHGSLCLPREQLKRKHRVGKKGWITGRKKSGILFGSCTHASTSLTLPQCTPLTYFITH